MACRTRRLWIFTRAAMMTLQTVPFLSSLPVSTVLQGEYGLKGLALSIPSVVGKSGVETVLEIPLSAQESAELQASAGGLRRVIATLPL